MISDSLVLSLELGGVRKRPAESGIGFCLPPARAWLYPAPLPGSQSVRHGRPTRRTTIPRKGRKKCENVKFTKFHQLWWNSQIMVKFHHKCGFYGKWLPKPMLNAVLQQHSRFLGNLGEIMLKLWNNQELSDLMKFSEFHHFSRKMREITYSAPWRVLEYSQNSEFPDFSVFAKCFFCDFLFLHKKVRFSKKKWKNRSKAPDAL